MEILTTFGLSDTANPFFLSFAELLILIEESWQAV
jgi:hypothetical protein